MKQIEAMILSHRARTIREALFGIGVWNIALLEARTTGKQDSKNVAKPSTRMNKLRNFDIPENQFTLSLAEIVFQKKAEPAGFRVDLDFGTSNDIVHGLAPYGTTPYNTLTNFQQAYLTAVIPVDCSRRSSSRLFQCNCI